VGSTSHLHSHITTIDSCNWRVQLNLYITQHGGEGEPVGRNPWDRRIKRLEQSIAHLAKRFDTQEEMLRAILDRLPPVPEASSSAPPGDSQ
jgi:hypothetical protein